MGNSKTTELRTQAKKQNVIEKINEKYTFSSIVSVSSTGCLPFQFRIFGIPCLVTLYTPHSSQIN
jgi:hypothetical protein